MLHPLLRLALARPDLLANHASAYAELALDNARDVMADWQLRLVGWALLAVGVLLCLVLAGVALLLHGAVSAPPQPWLLWAVPLAPLLLALCGAWLARRPTGTRRGVSVAQQFETDLSLLRARA
jgi:cytochrome bd-type quinol oxidase subunit 2